MGGGGWVLDILIYLTNIKSNILVTKQIADSWYEANIVILLEERRSKRQQELKSHQPFVTQLQNIYKTVQTRIEESFRKDYSVSGHLPCCKRKGGSQRRLTAIDQLA